ncbi:MAG: hypothetical protein KDA61_14175, partial [Planctomycetales bacterium]|nr:hypothetical protein [Planctomycetales bacterium]
MTEKDREQLLGYVLGALEPEEHAAVEARLAVDEALRAEAAKLRSSLAPLDEDLPGYDPPAGLAGRTCRLVAWTARKEAMQRRRETGVAEWASSQPSWTLTDAAVAAGVLVAMSLLFFPALVRSGQNAAVARCQDNLRQVGVGYSRYAQMNAGLFPSVTPSSNLAFAGLSPARLLDQGYLDNPKVLRCSSGGEVRTLPPVYAKIIEIEMPDGEVRRLVARLVEIPDSYAYNVGYRSGEEYKGCRKIEKRCRQGIAGDAPRCHARG